MDWKSFWRSEQFYGEATDNAHQLCLGYYCDNRGGSRLRGVGYGYSPGTSINKLSPYLCYLAAKKGDITALTGWWNMMDDIESR